MVSCLILALLAGEVIGDELFIASGRKLRPSQAKYIEGRMKKLRESNYNVRFAAVEYLIGLDKTALPLLVEAVEEGSNPTPVRCAILALSEIGGAEVSPLLERVVKSKRYGRDEKTIAALGLGKVDGAIDLRSLRSLLEPGEFRFVRKAAAMALARRKDYASAERLIKLARSDREDELASIFLLSAMMIGGEDVVKSLPRLMRSANTDRRRVLILGSAFLNDPVLLPTLLKYGTRDEDLHHALALCLGRYRSTEAVAFLAKIVSGKDPAAAIDALYSLAYQDKERAGEIFERAMRSERFASVRAHALLAMAEAGLVPEFMEGVQQALKDPSPQVRSAATLALHFGNPDGPANPLLEVLQQERSADVLSDLFMTLGSRKGIQSLKEVRTWAGRSGTDEPVPTAQIVSKVMEGKSDPGLIEERLHARLDELSARWSLRLHDAVMREYYKGLELDRIIRKAPDEDPTGGGGDPPDEPEVEDPGDSGEGGEDPGGDGGGDDGGGLDEPPAPAPTPTPPPDGTTERTGSNFLFRWEVLEWDLLLWMNRYPYFPESFFRPGS
jgi:HEAT repeat protein